MRRDIATGIAVTSLLYAISIYLPILGVFCAVFIPLPVFFYRAKLGRNSGLMICLASAAMMTFMLGGLSLDVLFFAELLLLGLVLGELTEYHLTVEATVLVAGGVLLGVGVAGLLAYSLAAQTSLGALVNGYVQKNLEITLRLYENMGMDQQKIQIITDSLDRIRYVLVGILPALSIGAVLMTTWLNLLMARPLFQRQSLSSPALGHLNRWKAPEVLVWVAIGSGGLLLIPSGPIKLIGLNGLLVLMTIYFFQGIAIVSYFFEKKRFPRLLRFSLYAIIVLQQLLVLVIIAIGFIDIWMNFRRLGNAESSA